MPFDPAERYHYLTYLFLSVFELPEELRERVLRWACIAPDLRLEVDQLLAIHDRLTAGAEAGSWTD